MGFYKDLTGQQIGYLTVLSPAGNLKGGRSLWNCKCVCGKEIVTPAAYGDTSLRSCGCRRYEKHKNGLALYKDKQQAQKNKTYRDLVNNALARDLQVNLTYDDWLEITQKPCFYCGREKSNTAKQTFKYNRSKLLGESFRYNGVDRLNSKKGYSPDNCVPCCKICNRAKSDMEPETFINWAISVAQNFYLPKVSGAQNV